MLWSYYLRVLNEKKIFTYLTMLARNNKFYTHENCAWSKSLHALGRQWVGREIFQDTLNKYRVLISIKFLTLMEYLFNKVIRSLLRKSIYGQTNSIINVSMQCCIFVYKLQMRTKESESGIWGV